VLPLERLAEDESAALLEHLAAEGGPAAEARARIAEIAEGNPLYLEQLLAFAAEAGGLAPEARGQSKPGKGK
jgi:predicted ATPase